MSRICDLCKYKSADKLEPNGSLSPTYYVLGDLTNKTELKDKQAFSIYSEDGSYMRELIGSIGIDLNEVRFNRAIRCYLDSLDEASDIRRICIKEALMDIYKSNPKIVLITSSDLSKFLLGDRFGYMDGNHGRIYTVKILDKEFAFMPTYNPWYVLKNTQYIQSLTGDIVKAYKYVHDELVNIDTKDLRVALTYDDFFKFIVDTNVMGADLVGYDLETNAQNPRSEVARIVGFSISPHGDAGIYVCRESLDYKMPDEDFEKIKNFMVHKLFPNKKLLVHNCQYEIPFTYNEWGFLIENFEDSLIKSRLILGGQIGASLKERAITDLGYPDWDTDLDIYHSSFTGIRKLIDYKPSGGERDEFTVFKSNSYIDTMNNYTFDRNSVEKDEKGNPKYSRSQKFYLYLKSIYDLMIKYYEKDELEHILGLIKLEIVSLIESRYDGPFSYGFVPMKLISKYGAMDSVATHDLNRFLDEQIDKYSEQLNIDLHKGYQRLKTQFIVGEWMEDSGLNFNDELAEKAKEWYLGMCLQSAKNMMNSGFLDNYLAENCLFMYNDYLKEHLSEIPADVAIVESIKKSGVKFVGDKRATTWKNILNRLGGKDYIFLDEKRKQHYFDLIRNYIDKSTDYSELKSLFNPGSPLIKTILSEILVTDDIKLANLMNKLNIMVEDPEFNIDKYSGWEKALFKVLVESNEYNESIDAEDQQDADSIEDIDNIVEGDEEGEDAGPVVRVKMTTTEVFEAFKEIITNPDFRVNSREMANIIGEALNYKLEKANEPSMVELNQYYDIIGCSIHNPDSWSKEYQFLIDFRLWKKCNKLRTTYIDGNKVGRGSVWLVDKKEFQDGKERLVKRKQLWYPGYDKEKYTTVYQSSFNVCGASSFRWKTAVHCLHPDTEILLVDGRVETVKNLYKEFKNGNYNMKVFSNNEVLGMSVELIRDIYISEKSSKMIRVHLSNGKSFEVTPNHKMVMLTGAYREASKLKVGDRLYPIRFKSNKLIYNPRTAQYEDVDKLIERYNKYRLKFKSLKYYSEIDYSEDIDYSLMNKRWSTLRKQILTFINSIGGCTVDNYESKSIGSKGRFYSLPVIIENFMDIYDGDERKLFDELSYMADCHIITVTKVEEINYDEPIDTYSIATHCQSPSYSLACGVMSKNTIPSGSDIKGFYTSRFKHGSIFMPDYCLDGTTKIRLADGTSPMIKDLVGVKEFEVLSYDEKSDDIVIGKGHDCRLVRYANDMMKLTLNTGEEILCTANHKFYDKYKKEFIEAKDWDFGNQFKLYYEDDYREIVKSEYLDMKDNPVYCFTVDKYHNFFLDCGVLSSNSAMEVRALASASNCQSMIDKFKAGLDIHRENAALIWEKPPEEVTEFERRYCKMACHIGSTKIRLADDSIKTIQELYESGLRNFYVKSYDTENNKIVYGKVCDVQLTKYTKDLMKVNFGDYREIICTPDHKFLLNYGEYVEAQDLEAYDIVESYGGINEVNWVEKYTPDEEVPVYDLSVETYHNYAIDLGDDSGVFVHNTFMMIYGGTEESFASQFLNGDLQLAKKIYSGFYKAYPEVLEFKEKKQAEMHNFGRVTTMMDMYLNITPELEHGDIGKAERLAVNAPIQSAGSCMAGNVMYEIKKFIEEHNLKSKIIMFVHDSIELDIHPDELLAVGQQVIPLMNDYPMKEFGMFTTAELSLGYSMGQELKTPDIICDDNFNEGEFVVDGWLDDFEDWYNNVKDYYKLVEVSDLVDPVPKYIDMGDLWIPKKAISSKMNTTRYEIKKKVHIVIK